MDHSWVKRLLGGLFVLVSVLLSVTALNGVKALAATYQDGTYTIGVQSSLKASRTNSATPFKFATTARAVVKDDTASVRLKTTGTSSQIKTATVNGKSARVANHSAVTFSLPVGTSSTTIAITLEDHSQQPVDGQLQFNWQAVKTVTKQATQSKTATSKADATPATSQIKALDPVTTKIPYRVLQANGKSISEANKYYTHEADVEQLADGQYQVTMHVDYAKNSGMTAKGFVPLTVNGQKVSNVKYGSTAKDYTASFSFTVSDLSVLKKAPVKGTIHVTVSLVNISSDFVIYYQFDPTTGSATQTTKNHANETANTSEPAKVYLKRHQVSTPTKQNSRRLPQTAEGQNSHLSIVGLAILVASFGTMILKKINAD